MCNVAPGPPATVAVGVGRPLPTMNDVISDGVEDPRCDSGDGVLALVEIAGGQVNLVSAPRRNMVKVFDWDAAEAACHLEPDLVRETIREFREMGRLPGGVGERSLRIAATLEHLLSTTQELTI